MTIELTIRHENPTLDRPLLVSQVNGRPGDTGGIVIREIATIAPGDQVRVTVWSGMFIAVAEAPPAAAMATPPDLLPAATAA